jgi:hypothetical protein
MEPQTAVNNRLQANQSVVSCYRHTKKSEKLKRHTHPTNGGEDGKKHFWICILLQTVCYNSTEQDPSTWRCVLQTLGEDDKTPIHIICDCGYFVEHRLDTIGVHQMPEDNPERDIDSIIKFLRKEEIILMEDC